MKTDIDWQKVELEYRAGLKTLREIARPYGISHTAVTKRATRDGWTRDLSAKIHAKAADLVSKSVVDTPKVSKTILETSEPLEPEKPKDITKEQRTSEAAIIEANAQRNADLQIAQRGDVTKARELTTKLLEELDGLVENKEYLEDLALLMYKPNSKGSDVLNDIYKKVIAFPGRVNGMKQLADSLRTTVELERRVYRIDEQETEGGIESFLRRKRDE